MLTEDDVAPRSAPLAVLQQLYDALMPQTWIYAKTMPHNPHEYALRKRWQGDASFDETVIRLREHGYQAMFGRRWYTQIEWNPKSFFG